ncbi:MAG: type pilus assembly protein PilV [Burkholderiales bacterium]
MDARVAISLRSHHRQHGLMLIEALISILILSVAILGLIGMEGAMIGLAQDAKHRADAAFLAEQVIGVMWADKRSERSSYAHLVTGTNCTFSGAASTNNRVTNWIGNANTAGTVLGTLPSATQQISFAGDKVTVTLCWQAQDLQRRKQPHKYVLVSKIEGGL